MAILGLILTLLLVGFVYEQISRFQAKRTIPVRGELISIGDHKLNINIKGKDSPLVVLKPGWMEAVSLYGLKFIVIFVTNHLNYSYFSALTGLVREIL